MLLLTLATRATLFVVLVGVVLSEPAGAEDYRTYFPRGWEVRVVPDGTIAAIEKRDPLCLLRAHGWKLLGTERRIADGLRSADTWQQWGWQIVVVNPSGQPAAFRTDITLVTEQARTLSTDSFPARDASSDPSQEAPVEVLPPTTMRIFSGRQWYNPRAHDGVGAPTGLGVAVECGPIED